MQIPLFGGDGELEERVIEGERGPKILLVELSGTLRTGSARGVLGLPVGESPVARLREELERAEKDDEIAALVLRIDSPGGSVIASEILHREVQRYRRESGRPVIAQLMGIAASGGYYVAMAADRVQAYPATITGSIGVIALGFNVSGLMHRLGVEYQTFTTGPFKDAGSPFRPITGAEREQLASLTRDLLVGFLDAVEAGRPKLARAEIERLADGRVFTARQALAAGLIDAIGDLPEAVEVAKAAAHVAGEARVIAYRRPGERAENLFSALGPAPMPVAGALREAIAESPFLYWWPGGADAAGLLEPLMSAAAAAQPVQSPGQ